MLRKQEKGNRRQNSEARRLVGAACTRAASKVPACRTATETIHRFPRAGMNCA